MSTYLTLLCMSVACVVVSSDPHPEKLTAVKFTRQERQLLFDPALRLSQHLDDDSLVGDGSAWRSPLERFAFYIKVLADLQDLQDRSDEQSDGEVDSDDGRSHRMPDFIPHGLLKRKIARTNARLLRYANEFEKIAHTTGSVKAAGGALGILGGALTLLGLGLAPFTAGGSLALTGVSMAASVAGGGILVTSAAFSVPGEVVAHQWEKHYIAKSADEAKSVMLHCQKLAGVLGHCHDAFERLDEFIRHIESGPDNSTAVDQEIALWFKNIYVTAMKSSDFAAMKNKMEIIKDVVKAGKSIRDFVSSSVDDLVTVRLKRLKDITLKKSLSKTMSQNAKYLLRQFSSDSALNFAASGVKIPWLKDSQLVWKTIIKSGTSAAVFISLAGSLMSVAAGIWGVLNGSNNMKGSGILSDRIRRAVADIDDYAERTFYLYDLLSAKAEEESSASGDHHRTPRNFKYRLPLVMTGIEVHTCWASGAGTDSPVRIEMESGGEKCITAVLETYGLDDLESNQWDTYDHEAVLGECAEFLLYSGEGGVRVRVVYGGLGAYCTDTINLQVGYLDRSRFTCSRNKNGSNNWTDSSKSVSDWMECDRSPDISRIDVFPCLSDYAGTDSAVRLALQSEKELCFTNVLDNNGNDLARGWKNSYRQDVLGDCSQMDILNDSLRLSLVHGGYDALCVGNVIVQGVDGEFGRSRDFKCDIPPQETIEYDTSAIYDCRPFNPDPARSVWGIRPHICHETHSGSSTGFDYGVAFELCSPSNASDCCRTNYLDMLYYDELVTGSAVIYSQPGALGQCYGFALDRDTLTVSVQNTNSADAICVESVDVFVKQQSRGEFPYASCDVGQLWTSSGDWEGPFDCRSARETTIAQIEIYVCDVAFAGSDSPIELQICRATGSSASSDSKNSTDDASIGSSKCCSTGVLDRPEKDDFERGDYEIYSGSQLRSCFDFAVDGDTLDLSVANMGSDGVCFGGVIVRTAGGDAMDCVMPIARNEYWADNGKMDLRCSSRIA